MRATPRLTRWLYRLVAITLALICIQTSSLPGPVAQAQAPAPQPAPIAAGQRPEKPGRELPGVNARAEPIPDEYIVVLRDDVANVPAVANEMAGARALRV